MYVRLCSKHGKAIWPLLFEKLNQRDISIFNLLKDLTYGGKWSFYHDNLQYEKSKPFPSTFTIMVDYCKKLLANEEVNILNSIRDILIVEEEAFIMNVIANNQEILINLDSNKDMQAKVKIYTVFGQLEYETNNPVSKGNQTIIINASNFKTGIYVVQITMGGKAVSQTISI